MITCAVFAHFLNPNICSIQAAFSISFHYFYFQKPVKILFAFTWPHALFSDKNPSVVNKFPSRYFKECGDQTFDGAH